MFRYGSKQWRITQMASGGRIEEAWPVLVILAVILIMAFMIHRFGK